MTEPQGEPHPLLPTPQHPHEAAVLVKLGVGGSLVIEITGNNGSRHCSTISSLDDIHRELSFQQRRIQHSERGQCWLNHHSPDLTRKTCPYCRERLAQHRSKPDHSSSPVQWEAGNGVTVRTVPPKGKKQTKPTATAEYKKSLIMSALLNLSSTPTTSE
jgi:hypothetical protein